MFSKLLDQQENAEADAATEKGRRHQSEVLIDARRRLLKAHYVGFASIHDCCCSGFSQS